MQKDAPFSLRDKPDTFLRDIKNWDVSFTSIIGQRKKSFINISGQYDFYDNIRASLFRFQTPVVLGLFWSWQLSEYVLNGTKDGFGHAVVAIGWNDKGLIIQNSAGLEAGQNGEHILPRAETNYFVSIYGAYTFIDFSPDEIREVIRRGIMIEQLNLMQRLLILLVTLKQKLNEKVIKPVGKVINDIVSKKN